MRSLASTISIVLGTIKIVSSVSISNFQDDQHVFTILNSEIDTLQQPRAKWPKLDPQGPLPWGDLNILSTTDTHGWLLGHTGKDQAEFSGDFGDLFSFQDALRSIAKEKKVDLIMVDAGDRVDGNGLVDAEPGGKVKGTTAMKYFREMPYDVITVGNHELYKYETARLNYDELRPHYGERFVVSNVDIEVDGNIVPLGNRFRIFETPERGLNILALGVLFNFHANAQGTIITPPCKMIHEAWFEELMRMAGTHGEKIDVVVLTGHMPVRGPTSDFSCVIKAIRKALHNVPILGIGGHHHIRDCIQYDDNSMLMASGRYMETVGWLSVANLTTSGNDKESSVIFARRYLDQNRRTYSYHAGSDFDTLKGQQISDDLIQVAKDFNLTYTFGHTPSSFFTSRYPPDSESSLLNLFTQHIVPDLLSPRDPDNHDYIFILNTGSIRYDIFKGPFTVNDQWASMPFGNKLEYVPNVARRTARMLLPYLNLVGEHQLSDSVLVEKAYHESLSKSYDYFQIHDMFSPLRNLDNEEPNPQPKLTEGYVTLDACPGIGDDTLHAPFPNAKQPTFVSTHLNSSGDSVDVVFLDFIRPDILKALNHLHFGRRYTDDDVDLFTDDLVANQLLSTYATQFWN